MQNTVKHLHEENNEEENKENRKKSQEKKKEKKKEENEETSVPSDFSACMFEYEDIAEFEQKFNLMRQKVSKQTWLDGIYKLKEKWAKCYMKDVFTLKMRSTQLSESLNNDLKIHFKLDFDIIRFFKHFERVMQGKRNNELNLEFDLRKKCLKYV
jgi:zinc finger SWIM domain-containing protein 3